MKVLIVDDHADTRMLCAVALTKLGHPVSAVSSIAMAQQAAGHGDCDLVICDIMLPDGSGYDLMGELYSRYGTPGIALTGCNTLEDRKRSLRVGFQAHIAKPFDLDVLERVVRSFETPARREPSSRLSD